MKKQKVADILEMQPDPVNPEKIVGLKIGIGRLSVEAREIVRVIFQAPAEMFEGAALPCNLQGKLRKYLKKYGMSLSEINQSFRQIKRMLRNL